MSAVFTGNGLGMFDGRWASGPLGDGRIGQGPDRQYVNLSTGNLVLQSQDEQLLFRGLSIGQVRTYNSQGLIGQVGQDAWLTGFERRIELLSGVLNEAGSVIRRHLGDGSTQDFEYVGPNQYRSTAGEGAHDTLTWEGSGRSWTYLEGSTRRVETYADHADGSLQGRLTGIRDQKSDGTEPVSWTVQYDASGRVSEVRAEDGTATGDALMFGYDGSGRLVSVSTRESGVVREQVSYVYDGVGRLASVITDLTPDDGAGDRDSWDASVTSNNDGYLFRTDYTYADATSLRITEVRQSDGSLVSYSYDSEGRIATLTVGDSNADDSDGVGQTLSFTYDPEKYRAFVSDSSGRRWMYDGDGTGRLSLVEQPPAGDGLKVQTHYSYDGDGNVTRIETERGGTVLSRSDYEYDASGNVLWQWIVVDPSQGGAARAVQRTYTSTHQLASETVFSGLDADGVASAQAPSGGQTTRYVYDAQDRLRFVINAAGDVSERVYADSGNGIGQLVQGRQYLGAGYTGSATLSALEAWATPAQRANGTLVQHSYDLQGRLSRTVVYAQVDGSGNGIEDDSAAITDYVYDAQGLLRQQVTRRSSTATANDGRDTAQTTAYAYDGLGRLLSEVVTEQVGSGPVTTLRTTVWSHVDSAMTLRTTLEGGVAGDGSGNDLLRMEVRDAAGQVVSTIESALTGGTTRTTSNHYDSTGRLRAQEDASGARRYFFYDSEGRLSGEVDATGAVVVYTRDRLGRVVATTGHATRVDTSGWLVGGQVVPTDIHAVKPAGHADDRTATAGYDAEGRVLTEVDGEGGITTYSYDGAGRLVQVRATDAAGTAATARVTRYFHDAAGREVARLDAEGYLVEYGYDRAGRRVRTVAYATATDPAQRASGTLAQLRPAAHAEDQVSRVFHDGRGNRVAELDAEGYLTEYVFDEARNERAVVAHARQLTGLSGSEPLSALRTQVQGGGQRESRRSFDAQGNLQLEVNPEGTVTRYSYDVQGRLLKTEAAQGTSEVREGHLRYDVFGNLIGELGGEGSTHLLAGMSEAQLDAVYAQYGVRHSYDALGRRIESIDAAGNKTWYFHDAAGRETFVVRGVADAQGVANAEGEITETRYTAFGQVSESTAYTGRIVIGVPGDRASVQAAIDTLSYVAAVDSRVVRSYDRRGLLSSRIGAEGARTDYSYDGFGQLTRMVSGVGDAAQTTTDYAYDARGLRIGTTEAVGTGIERTSTRELDAFGRVVSETDARGNVRSYGYDRLGRQISMHQSVDGRDRGSVTAYDAYGRVVHHDDSMGYRTSYQYDDVQRSMTVTSAEGVVVTTAYDRHGQTVSVTNGKGEITLYRYDLDGQLLETEDALGNLDRSEYDARGLLTATVDAVGRRTEYRYDAAGRVLEQIVDPGAGKLNLITRHLYDGQGRRIEVTDPAGRVVRYQFDREGRLLEQARDPDGLNLRTQFAYDALGRQVRMTEGAGSANPYVTQYDYDALGRRIAETVDPEGLALATTYAYDAADNMIRRTDALGAVTRYFYNQANEQVAVVDPLGAITASAYDRNGRLVATYAALTPIDTSQLNDGTTADQIAAMMQVADGDIENYRIYDRDGRLSLEVNGSGQSLTGYTYDAAGRVVETRRYANVQVPAWLQWDALALDDRLPEDYGADVLRDNANDRISWRIFDAAGRPRYVVDNGGRVTETYYDDSGLNIGFRRYATITDGVAPFLYGSGTIEDVQSLLIPDDEKDQREHLLIDAAGREKFLVDAAGAVTERYLDAAGNEAGTRRYANTVDQTVMDGLASGSLAVADLAQVLVDDTVDRYTYVIRDGAGRVSYRFVLGGQSSSYPRVYVSKTHYDAVGRVVLVDKYDNTFSWAQINPNKEALQAGSVTEDAVISWGVLESGQWRKESYVYDAAGRRRFTIKAVGVPSSQTGWFLLNESRFDAVGNRTSEIQYGKQVIAMGLPGDIASAEAVIASEGLDQPAYRRETQYLHDQLGNERFRIDAMGGVVENVFDALGRSIATVKYNLELEQQVLRTLEGLADWTSTASAQNAAVATTAYYDELGRTVERVDALGYSERYVYDALGNQVQYTDKLGSVWTYKYDSAGRRTEEVSPEVQVTSSDEYGWEDSGLRSIATRFNYDAFGSVIRITKDATGNYPATTEYEYDSRGNQVRTIFADGGVAEVVYNAFGQEAVNVDARGHISYKVYEVDGRLLYDIDQEGGVTRYGNDAYGELYQVYRYAKRFDFSKMGAGWVEGDEIRSESMARNGIAADAADRGVLYTRNAYGDLVTEANSIGGVQYSSVSYQYNRFGELSIKRVKLESSSSEHVETKYYYDRLGRLKYEVDANNYVTGVEYDALGRVVTRTEYARSSPYAPTSRLPDPGDATTGLDRITRYTYDALGRKISETQVRTYHVYTGSGYTTQSTQGDVSQSFQYDANGNVIATTNADGLETRTAYDALGRVISVDEGQRAVWGRGGLGVGSSLAAGSSIYADVSPYTTMAYDAFGNVTLIHRYGNGFRDGEEFPNESEADAITSYRYDAMGRNIWEQDAEGNVTTRAYDLAGNLVESRSALTGNDANYYWEVVTSATYDATGRQITTEVRREGVGESGYDPVIDSSSQVRYNTFGEIIAKDSRLDPDLDTSQFAIQYVYDGAGRLIRSNEKDGVWRDYSYNMAGHLLSESHKVREVAADGTVTIVDTVTWYTNDKLGRVLEQVGPLDSPTTEIWNTISYQYDRWGNVIQKTDPRGATTNYEYNQSSQLVRELRPTTTVVDATGASSESRPELLYFYDAMGRQIGTRDANGNTQNMVYDRAGQLIESVDGYGSATRYAYDEFGNRVLTQSALGYIQFTHYDLVNRVVRQGDYLVDEAGTNLTWTPRTRYVLDEAGNRRMVISEGAGGQTNTYYDYDSRGLLIRSKTQEGVEITYAYDSNGNKIRETQPLSESAGGTSGSPTTTSVPIANPGFEQGIGGWTTNSTNGAVFEVTPDGYTGQNALRMSGQGELQDGSVVAEQMVSVTEGQSMTVSAATRLLGGTYGTSYALVFMWYGANGELLGATSGEEQRRGEVGSGWRQDSFTTTVPTGVAKASIGFYFNSSDSSTESVVLVDDVSWDIVTNGRVEITDREGEKVFLHEQTWDYDQFNRLIDHNDLGGVDYDYIYDDQTGELIGQTVSTGAPLGGGSGGGSGAGTGGIENPGFEQGDAGWEMGGNASSVVEVASGGYTGSSALRMSGTGLGNDGAALSTTLAEVSAGQTVSMSAMTRFESGGSDAGYAMVLYWYDADGNQLFFTVQDRQTLGDAGTGWRQDNYSIVVPTHSPWTGQPVDVASVKAGFWFYSADSTDETVIWVDDVEWNLGGSEPDPGPQLGDTIGDRQFFYYRNGLLKEIRETTAQGVNWTRYTYDVSGNRASEETFTHDANGEALQLKTTTEYDEHNRIARTIQDDIANSRRILDVRYEYDAMGNRRHVSAGTSYNPSGDQPINPDFEAGDTGWLLGEGWSIAQVGDGGDAHTGTWGAKFSGTGSHSITNERRVQVQPGQTVQASIMVQQGASSAGGAAARVLIVWYDANGDILPGGEGKSWTGGNVVNSGSQGEWKKSQVTTKVPTGAAFMGFDVSANKDAGDAPLYIDDAQWSYQSDGDDGELVISQEYWYDYDRNNRVAVANGALVNGEIVVANDGESYALSYDADGRAVFRMFMNGGALKEELTEYDQRGQRVRVFQAVSVGSGGNGALKESYAYDDQGRQIERRTYFDAGTVRNGVDISGWLKHAEQIQYDNDGRVTHTQVLGRVVDWTASAGGSEQSTDLASLTLLSEVNYVGYKLGYDSAGRVVGYRYTVHRNEEGTGSTGSTPYGYSHTYSYTYTARDSYLEYQISGVSTHNDFKASSSTSTYDEWGRRLSIREQTPKARLDDRIRYFSYDAEGNILRRREGELDENGVFSQDPLAEGQTQVYAYVSGQTVGSGKYNGDLDVIGRLTAYDSSTTGSRRITVQAGDTLRAIAQRVYGNGNLWYVIAQANAVDDSELSAGTTLVIPDVQVTSNDASTFKPFDLGEAIGNTAPSLPYIPPPPKQGCSGVAGVLIAVVAIVVTVYTAGAAAGFFGLAGGAGTAATGAAALAGGGGLAATGGLAAATSVGFASAAAAAVGGFVGSVAAQAVGSALGETSFSWRNAAASGLTAGFTAGIGSQLGPMSELIKNNQWGKVALSGGLNGAGAYASRQIAGQQVPFSWRSIAASAVSAVAGGALNRGLGTVLPNPGQSDGIVNDTIGGFVNDVSSLHVRRQLGFDDPIHYGNMATDAFGNALGNAIVAASGRQAAERRDGPPAGGMGGVHTGVSSVTSGVYEIPRSNAVGSMGTPASNIDTATGAHVPGTHDDQGIHNLETVRVTAVADDYSSNGWYFYGWNQNRNQWVDVQRRRIDAVRWSRPPAQQGSNPAIRNFTMQLQEYIDAQPKQLWQMSASERFGIVDPSDLQGGVRPTGVMRAPDPLPLRERALQAMRESWIGDSAPGRAYLGAVDFVSSLPGEAIDAARSTGYLLTPQGRMEVVTGLAREVQENGVAGTLANGVRGAADGASATYRQAYFGTEEDRVKAILDVGSVFAGGRVASRAGGVADNANVILRQKGLADLALPRTSGLGSTSTTGELLRTGAIPGVEGVMLQQKTVPFGDIWALTEKHGVEFLLFKDNGAWMLRSGSRSTVPVPAGIRPTVHSHALDEFGFNSKLPSRADINVLNDYWARNPSQPRPVSQILVGDPLPIEFRATGIDPWLLPRKK